MTMMHSSAANPRAKKNFDQLQSPTRCSSRMPAAITRNCAATIHIHHMADTLREQTIQLGWLRYYVRFPCSRLSRLPAPCPPHEADEHDPIKDHSSNKQRLVLRMFLV